MADDKQIQQEELERILALANVFRNGYEGKIGLQQALTNSDAVTRTTFAPSSLADKGDQLTQKQPEDTQKKFDEEKKAKDEDPHNKLTGRIAAKDYDGDGDIDGDDAKIEQEIQQQGDKQQPPVYAMEVTPPHNRFGYKGYRCIEANLLSSTVAKEHAGTAERSMTHNTDVLIETMAESKKNSDGKVSEKDQKAIEKLADVAGDAQKEAYTKILTAFDKAIDGKTPDDFKKFNELIDGLSEKDYGLNEKQRQRIKDLFKDATPEQRAALLKEALYGNEEKHIKGVDKAELEIMKNSPDVMKAMEDYATKNKLDATTCFGRGCTFVADLTFRANLVHLANDMLVEKDGHGLVADPKNKTALLMNQPVKDVLINNLDSFTGNAVNNNEKEKPITAVSPSPSAVPPAVAEYQNLMKLGTAISYDPKAIKDHNDTNKDKEEQKETVTKPKNLKGF